MENENNLNPSNKLDILKTLTIACSILFAFSLFSFLVSYLTHKEEKLQWSDYLNIFVMAIAFIFFFFFFIVYLKKAKNSHFKNKNRKK